MENEAETKFGFKLFRKLATGDDTGGPFVVSDALVPYRTSGCLGGSL